MVSLSLENSHFPGAHTAEAFHGKIMAMMSEWKELQDIGQEIPIYFVPYNIMLKTMWWQFVTDGRHNAVLPIPFG
jgi:hypothetical protein